MAEEALTFEDRRRQALLKKRIETINTAYVLFSNTMKRHATVRDASTKHLMFLDKLCTIMDSVCAVLTGENSDLPEESKVKAKELVEGLNSNILNLMNWIQEQPPQVESKDTGSITITTATLSIDDK